MNNKGQTLVLFIALIPFVFMLIVFVIDLSKLSSEKTFIEGIANEAYESLNKGHSIKEVETIIKKHDNDIIIDKIEESTVCLSKKVNPVFGSFIGLDFWNAKYCAK